MGLFKWGFVHTFGLLVSIDDTGGGDKEWDGGPSDCDLSFRSFNDGFR